MQSAFEALQCLFSYGIALIQAAAPNQRPLIKDPRLKGDYIVAVNRGFKRGQIKAFQVAGAL